MKRNTTALGREVTFSAPGEYVPGGIVADADGNFWLSVFWTRRPKVGYFIKVDPKEMKELESVTVNEFISPGYDPTHGISIDGDYIYLMGVQSLNTEFYYERSGVIRRFNLKTKRLEKAGDVFKDVPEVQFIGCNPIVDSRTHLGGGEGRLPRHQPRDHATDHTPLSRRSRHRQSVGSLEGRQPLRLDPSQRALLDWWRRHGQQRQHTVQI